VVTREWPPDSLLGMLPDAARERLLSRGALVRYPRTGMVLIRENDKSRSVIIILSGVVKVTGSVPDGPDVLLAIRMGGDAVGEFAAVDQLPRSATVAACGAVLACVIKAADFVACIRHDPDISHAISKAIVAKMRVASQRRVDFSGSDVPTRVARVLLHLVTCYGKPYGAEQHGKAIIDAPLTQLELASLAVASPPAVQRALRQLRNSGIIATGYRSIAVLDIGRLRYAAYNEPDQPYRPAAPR
jgi:CRP/FNR family cyclic AMP-dependent transcriptional regulator